MGRFFNSMIREIGRNTGKVVSNAIFGDGHSTPHRLTHRMQDSRPKREAVHRANINEINRDRKGKQQIDEREVQRVVNNFNDEIDSMISIEYPLLERYPYEKGADNYISNTKTYHSIQENAIKNGSEERREGITDKETNDLLDKISGLDFMFEQIDIESKVQNLRSHKEKLGSKIEQSKSYITRFNKNGIGCIGKFFFWLSILGILGSIIQVSEGDGEAWGVGLFWLVVLGFIWSKKNSRPKGEAGTRLDNAEIVKEYLEEEINVIDSYIKLYDDEDSVIDDLFTAANNIMQTVQNSLTIYPDIERMILLQMCKMHEEVALNKFLQEGDYLEITSENFDIDISIKNGTVHFDIKSPGIEILPTEYAKKKYKRVIDYEEFTEEELNNRYQQYVAKLAVMCMHYHYMFDFMTNYVINIHDKVFEDGRYSNACILSVLVDGDILSDMKIDLLEPLQVIQHFTHNINIKDSVLGTVDVLDIKGDVIHHESEEFDQREIEFASTLRKIEELKDHKEIFQKTMFGSAKDALYCLYGLEEVEFNTSNAVVDDSLIYILDEFLSNANLNKNDYNLNKEPVFFEDHTRYWFRKGQFPLHDKYSSDDIMKMYFSYNTYLDYEEKGTVNRLLTNDDYMKNSADLEYSMYKSDRSMRELERMYEGGE